MGRADLHIHTNEGDGLDSVERVLAYVEERTDLDVVAITEHDHLETALAAREAWSRGRYRFDFVTGVEITTLQGHVVALYLEEPVPSLRRVEETLDAVHRQGGVCFVPHPMSWLTRSIGPGTFDRLRSPGNKQQATGNKGTVEQGTGTTGREDGGVANSLPVCQSASLPGGGGGRGGTWFDAVELANPSPTSRLYLAKARRLNRERYGLPAVGASDAHFVEAIGCAHTEFAGSTAADLRGAFATGALAARESCYPRFRDVGLRRVLALPLAGLGATPRRLGWRRTAWSFVDRYRA